MRLYTYFRSSAAFRVRIALAYKGVPYTALPVHLLKEGGQQLQPAYLAINPQGQLPALETGEGDVLTQSLAILEYLEEVHPHPALLPADPVARAKVRAMALAIACDIHPVNNLAVLKHLRGPLALEEAAVTAWIHHWMARGFTALERMVAPDGPYCWGEQPTLADLCLVPQMFNARRFGLDLAPYPRLVAIDAACMALPAFQMAAPANQPDAE